MFTLKSEIYLEGTKLKMKVDTFWAFLNIDIYVLEKQNFGQIEYLYIHKSNFHIQ